MTGAAQRLIQRMFHTRKELFLGESDPRPLLDQAVPHTLTTHEFRDFFTLFTMREQQAQRGDEKSVIQ